MSSVLQPSLIRGLATLWTYLSLTSAILIDSSMVSPVHVLMLSIQAVCGLPGTVPCIISFSRHNSLVSFWCDHSILASLLWQSLIHPSLLQLCLWPTHLFFHCLRNSQYLFQSFHLKGIKTFFFILSKCPVFTAVISSWSLLLSRI